MKKSLLFILGTCICFLGQAQTLQTAYFSEDYAYSYRLNPAFHAGYSFVGLPFIGNSSAAYKGSFSLNDLFYKQAGERVTFMNQAVSSSDFLGNFKKGLNSISSESYSTLGAVGFKAGGMYNIVEVNFRNYLSGKLPYDLMRYLKDGATSHDSFDLSGLRAHATSFMEIGITSSWKLNRKLTIGMRFKGVIGQQNSYIDMDRMVIKHIGNEGLPGSTLEVSADGVLASAYDGYEIASMPASEGSSVALIDLRNTRVGEPKGIMNGYGVGADVGILYDDSSWQLSASVSDIGCIFWFHNLYGHAPLSTRSIQVNFTPHTHGTKPIYNEFSDMGALLGDAFGFVMEDEYQALGLLPLTVRLGAKYLYLSDLSFGGLATFRYDDICPYFDLRGSVDYKLSKSIELIGSIGGGTHGISAGVFANLKWKFINLFAGTDNLFGTAGTAFVPSCKGAPNGAFGLNIIW
ncbi:MAG: hypothetical protein IJK73_07440 [Bacteroidales bacterium]|nr:hypothetical protein [Bacteroidales bacterium]